MQQKIVYPYWIHPFIAVRSTFSMLIGSLTENLIQWLSSRRVSFAQSLLKVTELQLSKSRRRFIVRTISNMFGSELIIFHVNCSEACFFVIKFFYFLFLKWESFFKLNKETSWEIDKVRKGEYKQDKSSVIEFCRCVFDSHQLSSRAWKSHMTMSNLCKINELLHTFFWRVSLVDLIICFCLLIVLKLCQKL